MTEKRYSHDGVVIIDHLKKDLIYIDGKENLLELAEYVDKLQEENEQLKSEMNDLLKENISYKNAYLAYKDDWEYEKKWKEKYKEENEQLKQSSTMYHNLFLEWQKMMKGVKKASDLDSKDFEDLIELSKGNVFDDELGWIHLPIKKGDDGND